MNKCCNDDSLVKTIGSRVNLEGKYVKQYKCFSCNSEWEVEIVELGKKQGKELAILEVENKIKLAKAELRIK